MISTVNAYKSVIIGECRSWSMKSNNENVLIQISWLLLIQPKSSIMEYNDCHKSAVESDNI